VGSVNPTGLSVPTLAYSVPGVLSALSGSFRNVQPSEATKQWYVNERALTGYIQVNIDGDVAASPYRQCGSAGGAHQAAFGGQCRGRHLADRADRSWRQLHLCPAQPEPALEAGNNVMHVAVSRTMSRARLLDENSSFTVALSIPRRAARPITSTASGWCCSGGRQSASAPLFLEQLSTFRPRNISRGQGVIGLSAFWKQISNFVDPNNSYQYDLSAFPARSTAKATTELHHAGLCDRARQHRPRLGRGRGNAGHRAAQDAGGTGRLWRARQRGLSRSSIRYANGSR
jgi:iron complex outermembrane receptor protein